MDIDLALNFTVVFLAGAAIGTGITFQTMQSRFARQLELKHNSDRQQVVNALRAALDKYEGSFRAGAPEMPREVKATLFQLRKWNGANLTEAGHFAMPALDPFMDRPVQEVAPMVNEMTVLAVKLGLSAVPLLEFPQFVPGLAHAKAHQALGLQFMERAGKLHRYLGLEPRAEVSIGPVAVAA